MNPGEHLGWGGWWIIPMAMPGIMVLVVLIILYFLICYHRLRMDPPPAEIWTH